MTSNKTEEPGSTPTNRPASRRFRWLVIIVILLAPAVLAYIGAALNSEDSAVASPLIGGGIGGIYCGMLAVRRFGKTPSVKILLGLLIGAVTACTIIGIGFAGCMLGGFTIRFG
jgi:hypothetical protein